MRYFILNILLFFAFDSFCQEKVIEVKGIIFEDTNGNGIKDKSERKLKNIPISNGEDVILSNEKGEYALQVKIGNSVFAIPPAEYKLSSTNKNRNADFLYIEPEYYSNTIKYDIALNRQDKEATFQVGVIGDIQMKDYQEINYANQTIIPELMQRNDIAFNIFLGDQINETLDLLPDVKKMIEGLPMPSWSVFGNHDRNIDESKLQDRVFNRYFGASHYAFNYGHIHFIILNNVYSKDNNRNYTGYISEEQLNFLKNDLQYVPKDKTIVLCQHIPMTFTHNKESALDILTNRKKVLILSGHTHQIGRHIFAPNIQELTAGATCGNWWVGERDWLGIPTALMQCGSPKGYFTIDFCMNDYKIHFKGISLDPAIQMDIWVNGQDSIDEQIEDLKILDKDIVVANIYGGSDSTKVMMQIDDGEWVKMKQSQMPAPSVTRLISLNKDGVYPTKYSRRGALRKRESPHIWTTKLSKDLDIGIHSIRIKAEDNYGYSSQGSRLIYISDKEN